MTTTSNFNEILDQIDDLPYADVSIKALYSALTARGHDVTRTRMNG